MPNTDAGDAAAQKGAAATCVIRCLVSSPRYTVVFCVTNTFFVKKSVHTRVIQSTPESEMPPSVPYGCGSTTRGTVRTVGMVLYKEDVGSYTGHKIHSRVINATFGTVRP